MEKNLLSYLVVNSNCDKKNIFLIDCVNCKNLGWLKNILENKKKLIIFHSVRSDATVLNTNLKIKVNNTYDVQIAEKK